MSEHGGDDEPLDDYHEIEDFRQSLESSDNQDDLKVVIY